MPPMHADELQISPALVRRLLETQHPQWAALPIRPVLSAGTDNSIFRLGEEWAVRLPRRPGAVECIEKELAWLPVVGRDLPLPVPVPVAAGEPGEGFPWHWYLYRWLPGDNATAGRGPDLPHAAQAMAGFISALQQVDPKGGPGPGSHNFNRGEPLRNRDAFTRAGIASLPPEFDQATITAVWNEALDLPDWDGPPVWIHGDLQPGNLLVVDGRLSAVIDFGGLGVGDPACDLMVGWNLLDAATRPLFRAGLPHADDATWARGRGWALSVWVGGVAYYMDTFPAFVAMARRTIAEVLADHAAGN
jgi:aminoglycoside phosphotransferase (APT) family kinase protein